MLCGRIAILLRIEWFKKGVKVWLWRLRYGKVLDWRCGHFCPFCEYSSICYESMKIEQQ